MRRLIVAAVALALLTGASATLAQGVPQATVTTYAMKIDGQHIEVLFRVADRASGRDIQNLKPADVTLSEDGAAVAGRADLHEERADNAQPTRLIALDDPSGATLIKGSTPVTLTVAGATIGVVYDVSTLTNTASDKTNYIERGRMLIEALLEAGRTQAPENPEAIGLFFPLSVPAVSGQEIRPKDLAGFVQDRNAVINALRQQAPRTTKTNVFDTLAVAIGMTADEASHRGTDAYVLLVTDGGDSASVGSYDALVSAATSRGVKLLILGVGPQKRLAANAAALTTLAGRSGGAFLPNPDAGAVQNLYRSSVVPTGQSAYVVSYTTTLIDDDKPHSLVIQVSGTAAGQSDHLPIARNGMIGSQSASLPIGPALQGYAIRAVPVAIFLSLLFSGLLILIQRISDDRSKLISGGNTRR